MRYDKKARKKISVPIPHVLKMYNNYMGSVDKNNMLVAWYRTTLHTQKYYIRIYYYLMDLCVVNAWILYRKSTDSQRKNMDLMTFKLNIARSLASDQHQHNTSIQMTTTNLHKQVIVFRTEKLKWDSGTERPRWSIISADRAVLFFRLTDLLHSRTNQSLTGEQTDNVIEHRNRAFLKRRN